MGVSFHVGSQCMRPTRLIKAGHDPGLPRLVRAGVFADVVRCGGGFPSVYPGMCAGADDYVDSIEARLPGDDWSTRPPSCECEPGRPWSPRPRPCLVKVGAQKGDAL